MKTIHMATSQKSILKLFLLPVLLLIAVVTLSFHTDHEYHAQTENPMQREGSLQECSIQDSAISKAESKHEGNNYQSLSADKLNDSGDDIGGQSSPRVPPSAPKLVSNAVVDIGGNGNAGSMPKPIPYDIHNALEAHETFRQESILGGYELF